MRILLIQAKTAMSEAEGAVFPLGLSYLAAALPQGWEARGLDMNLHEDPFAALAALGREFQPDLAALSVRNIKVAMPGEHISSGLEVAEMARGVKDALPGTPLICGGAGFTLYAEWFMERIPEIDYGFKGEGEASFPRFLAQFPNPEGVQGLAYRRNGDIVWQGLGERPDFPALPRPDRTVFPVADYLRWPTAVGVMTKRGCPYRCIHCSDLYLLGTAMRLRPPKDVVDEIEALHREHGVTHFMFADQTFNQPVEHTKEILRTMLERGLDMRWSAYFSPEGLDEELVDLFKRTGCEIVGFSPDCCGDRVMDCLQKGFSMRDVRQSNRLLKAAGIPVTYNFMLGLPGETLGSLLRSLWFIVATKLYMGRHFHLHGLFIVPVRIYPHTQLRQMAQRSGLLGKDDDLMRPRFSGTGSRVVDWADRAVLGLVTALWKAKRLVRILLRRRPPHSPGQKDR
jgi:radical SAM superfamily enzyme YgiQ (UPF0313 family)